MKEIRVGIPTNELDRFMPAYQFHEFHQIRVAASPATAYRAIKNVTAGEIRLFRALTWMRRFGRELPEGVLNAPKNEPVLEVALRTSFYLLADLADSEIVVGTVVLHPQDWNDKDWNENDRACISSQNWHGLSSEGFALAAMNFRIVRGGDDQCTVTTETRVYGTDARTARKFARYWRMIYPGSAFIRRMWLRAIKRRAQLGGR